MSTRINAGDLIIDHSSKDIPARRIILIDKHSDTVWTGSIDFLTKNEGQKKDERKENKDLKKKSYCPQPKPDSLAKLVAQIDAGLKSCIAFETPEEWSWKEDDFGREDFSIVRRERRSRTMWKARRDKAYSLISPLVEGKSIEEILKSSLHRSWPLERAAALGLKSARDIYNALHRFLVGLGEKNAVTPGFGRCGGKGKPKYFKTPPGCLTKGETTGFNLTKNDRIRIGLGWAKHKKKKVSVTTAYARFLNEFYCEKAVWVNSRMEVTLLPTDKRPSIHQFAAWGPRYPENLKASQVNGGETAHRNRAALRSGKERTSVAAMGIVGQVDCSPSDQNLVSESSRLKVLRTPYRMELIDPLIGYIYGIHVGFEPPSTTTALLAILNGASSKVAFCARYNVGIQEDQWLSQTFRRIIADNGEMKTEEGMTSVEDMDASLEFCESYFGERKAAVESSHRRTQTLTDHLIPGSSKGRLTDRGDPSPARDACFTFQEYMPRLIHSILYRNNEEIIPYPLIEMRKDGIRPVRSEMVKWCIDKGYVASTPTDINMLRVRCLPRLKAVLRPDGIHLFDPTQASEKLIPVLRYKSTWLDKSGLLERAYGRHKRLEAHVDPSSLREIWVNLDGLRALQIQSRDPYMQQVTLFDWLTICRDDSLSKALAYKINLEFKVGQVASIAHVEKNAKSEKKAEVAGLPKKPGLNVLQKGKRKNTLDEIQRQTPWMSINNKTKSPCVDGDPLKQSSGMESGVASVKPLSHVGRLLKQMRAGGEGGRP